MFYPSLYKLPILFKDYFETLITGRFYKGCALNRWLLKGDSIRFRHYISTYISEKLLLYQ